MSAKAKPQLVRPVPVPAPGYLFSIKDAAGHLRISVACLWVHIGNRKLKTVKLGGRTMIRGEEIARFVASL